MISLLPGRPVVGQRVPAQAETSQPRGRRTEKSDRSVLHVCLSQRSVGTKRFS